jgi:hypothetical protein
MGQWLVSRFYVHCEDDCEADGEADVRLRLGFGFDFLYFDLLGFTRINILSDYAIMC